MIEGQCQSMWISQGRWWGTRYPDLMLPFPLLSAGAPLGPRPTKEQQTREPRWCSPYRLASWGAEQDGEGDEERTWKGKQAIWNPQSNVGEAEKWKMRPEKEAQSKEGLWTLVMILDFVLQAMGSHWLIFSRSEMITFVCLYNNWLYWRK